MLSPFSFLNTFMIFDVNVYRLKRKSRCKTFSGNKGNGDADDFQ